MFSVSLITLSSGGRRYRVGGGGGIAEARHGSIDLAQLSGEVAFDAAIRPFDAGIARAKLIVCQEHDAPGIAGSGGDSVKPLANGLVNLVADAENDARLVDRLDEVAAGERFDLGEALACGKSGQRTRHHR